MKVSLFADALSPIFTNIEGYKIKIEFDNGEYIEIINKRDKVLDVRKANYLNSDAFTIRPISSNYIEVE